jgi:hypothetical protein
MAINVYVLFPEDEMQILDTVENQNKYDTFVKNIVSILKGIHKNNDLKLYYDSSNIANYISTCILWDETKNIKDGCDLIRHFLTRKSTDVNTCPLKDSACKYVLWNYDKSPTVEDNPNNMLIEMTEREYKYPEEKSILLDACSSITPCRGVFLTFKDAKHIEEYPARFVRIPYVWSQSELELWLKTNHVKTFSLFDKNRFQRTGQTFHAKPIFQEINTGNYWYLDNFHKDEYEVFSANCQHVGTANLQGEMNPNSQVNGRVITL